MKYANPLIETLVQYSAAGREGKYNELLAQLKAEQPKAYRSLKRIADVNEPHIDTIWHIFNSQMGGTADEVEALEARLAKIK